ncbi:hypothetical protein WDW89_07850 [Deltaproteobacteria bacterium TL4]
MSALSKTPKLLVIIDGMGDRPLDVLDERTPLQWAYTPTMDYLARNGRCGHADPISRGKVPTTASGTLAILGYDSSKYKIRRGVVEAFGVELLMSGGDVAWRGNWASLDEDHNVLDRRAGRIRKGTDLLAKSLNEIVINADYQFQVGIGTEHRFALVLRGKGLSDQIRGSDPLERNAHGKRITPYPLDENNLCAKKTAELLDQFERKAMEVLKQHPVNLERSAQGRIPVNAILTREPGMLADIPPLSFRNTPIHAICITGDKTIAGVCKMTNIDVRTTPGMTANLDTDLNEKFACARKSMPHYELVIVHIKGCDIAAHNRQGKVKSEFLEKIDQALARFMASWTAPIRIILTADHATCSKEGYHTEDPVPALLYGSSLPADKVQFFDEISVGQGALGRFNMQHLMNHLFA